MKMSFIKRLHNNSSDQWWVSHPSLDRERRNELRDKIKLRSPSINIDEDKPEDGLFGSRLHNNFNYIWIKFDDPADEAEFILLGSGEFDL